ncbi:MAG: acyl-CoA dehydrogenase family protein [Parvibaculaceae bacterium]
MPPTAEELIARADGLMPYLKAQAEAAERNRRISDETARRLIDAGFFNIVMPKRFGGYGLRHGDLWRVARQIGRACASTGWILGLMGISPWIVGLFEARAQEEVFASGNPIVPVMTGGAGRNLKAVARPEGFEVSGCWRYGSGVDLCSWAIAMAPVDAATSVDVRLFLLPRQSLAVDEESWKVLGMRGTGSKDVHVERAFVPLHRSISWTDAQNGIAPGTPLHQDPMYSMPLNPLFAMSVVAPVVGAGFGALDLVSEILAARAKVGNGAAPKHETYAQIQLGQARAAADMAFSLLIADADEMYDVVATGAAFSMADRARYRAHCSQIAGTMLAAAEAAYRLAGGGLLPAGTALERSFRDIHAMTTHFLIQPDLSAEIYGRILLGLDVPDGARL